MTNLSGGDGPNHLHILLDE